MISQKHIDVLKRRAVEQMEALVEAEIRWRNGELDDTMYRLFKKNDVTN